MKTTTFLLLPSSGRRSVEWKKLLSVISSRHNNENHNISAVAVKWKKKLLSVFSSPVDSCNNENHNISAVAVKWRKKLLSVKTQ